MSFTIPISPAGQWAVYAKIAGAVVVLAAAFAAGGAVVHWYHSGTIAELEGDLSVCEAHRAKLEEDIARIQAEGKATAEQVEQMASKITELLAAKRTQSTARRSTIITEYQPSTRTDCPVISEELRRALGSLSDAR